MPIEKPGPDEMYCWSCGSAVKRRAALCMVCGVRLANTRLSAPRIPSSRPASSTKGAGTTNFAAAGAKDLPKPRFILAMLLAIAGGIFGILGAIQAELPALVLAPYVWAPVAEEVLKPVGIYIMLLKWPAALKNQAYTAMLSALAGLTFGLVESTAYMTVYFPEHTRAELVYRYTVPVLLHVTTSFIFGLGINRRILGPMAGAGGFRSSNWVFFLAAIVLHSAYNITVAVLSLAGVI